MTTRPHIHLLVPDWPVTVSQEHIAALTNAFRELNQSRSTNPYTALSPESEQLLGQIAEAIARAQNMRSHLAVRL